MSVTAVYRNRTRIFLFALLLSSFLLAGNVAAQETGLIEVTSSVDTSVITIGDRITYTISLSYRKDLHVEKPGEGLNLGQFEIKDYSVSEPVEAYGRIDQKFEYVISVFDTGRFTIPPFPIAYFPENASNDYRIIEASPLNIYVRSVMDDAGHELRDVKGPLDIPFDYLYWSIVLLIVLALAAAAYYGYQWYRRRMEEQGSILPKAPPKPAHEVALEALEKLLAENLPEKGEIKQFYVRISEIIRSYIEGRWFVPALEQTSDEILTAMNKQDLADGLDQLLREFLSLSDLVKFARYLPESGETTAISHDAREFIDRTKIIFVPEPVEEINNQTKLTEE